MSLLTLQFPLSPQMAIIPISLVPVVQGTKEELNFKKMALKE